MDSATHDELSGRLRGLLINVSDRLTELTCGFVTELMDASEFGVALETMADMLSEDEQPISPDERAEFIQLAERMRMGDRVSYTLSLCPTRT